MSERDSYENSLKYYRDLNNVIDTSREEGKIEGRKEEKLINLQRQRALIIRQLTRKLGAIPNAAQIAINQLFLAFSEALGEALFDFSSSNDLIVCLEQEEKLNMNSIIVFLYFNHIRVICDR